MVFTPTGKIPGHHTNFHLLWYHAYPWTADFIGNLGIQVTFLRNFVKANIAQSQVKGLPYFSHPYQVRSKLLNSFVLYLIINMNEEKI